MSDSDRPSRVSTLPLDLARPKLLGKLPRVEGDAPPAWLAIAGDQLERSRPARVGVMTLAFLALVAIFADVLAADLPLACRIGGDLYLAPNVTQPGHLSGETVGSLRARAGPGGFVLAPLVAHGPVRESTEISQGPRREHPFGTDSRGRDVFARVVHGTRASLTFGLLTALAFVAFGAGVGALAGFFGGFFDSVVTRLVEVITAFPTLILVLVVQAVVPRPSAFTMLVTIAATRWTEVARIVRAEVLFASSQDYAMAARALGASPLRVLRRHVLPNALMPALVAATFSLAAVILIEASLDFLHLGARLQATPSWGQILGDARTESGAFWLLFFPGMALLATVLALNLVGEALRDALDPRLRDAPETVATGLTK